MKKIALSGKNGKGMYVTVDDEDFEFLNQFSWSLSSKGYAAAYIPVKFKHKYGNTNIQMQRMLMWDSVSNGQIVDHINRDKLDNRKENLRICNMSESNMNRGVIHFKKRQNIVSSYKGVWWDKTKWRSAITVNGRKIYLGRFNVEKDAAVAYNNAAKIYFGEHAYLNNVN